MATQNITTTASIKFITLALLAMMVLGGALLYSSSLVAGQQSEAVQVQAKQKQATRQQPHAVADIAMLQPRHFQQRSEETGNEAPRSALKEVVLPVGTWFLGSALLAMVGYKRMRNSETGTD